MSKLVNSPDVEFWEKYLGKYANYFALYANNHVGFWRPGSEESAGIRDSRSIEIDLMREGTDLSLFIEPATKDSYTAEWTTAGEEILICIIDLNDPNGPKLLQKKVGQLIELFEIEKSDLEHNMQSLFDE